MLRRGGIEGGGEIIAVTACWTWMQVGLSAWSCKKLMNRNESPRLRTALLRSLIIVRFCIFAVLCLNWEQSRGATSCATIMRHFVALWQSCAWDLGCTLKISNTLSGADFKLKYSCMACN